MSFTSEAIQVLLDLTEGNKNEYSGCLADIICWPFFVAVDEICERRF